MESNMRKTLGFAQPKAFLTFELDDYSKLVAK